MDIDLDDPRLFLRADVVEDPKPLYDELRRRAPVWQIPRVQAFVISAPALIREAVARPADFSSNLVQLLHDDGTGCPVPFDMSPYENPVHVLSTADPPLHTRHRQLLQSHLTPAALAVHEPALRRIVDAHLDPLLAAGRGDAVAAFSDPVPAAGICTAVGVPPEDAARIVSVVSAVGALLDGITDLDGMRAAGGAAMELGLYVYEHLTGALERSAAQRPGLLAVLAGAVDDGELTVEQATAILLVLVSAGSETTSSLLATAIERIARDEPLQVRLRTHPEQIPAAIEAFLREDGPFQFHYRWTPADTTIGGCPIPASSMVLPMWAAANRPAPDASPSAVERIEPGNAALHYAFGRGLHFCIGAALARLEARVALEQLLARTSWVALDPQSPPMQRPSIFIRRHASLPVVLTVQEQPGTPR